MREKDYSWKMKVKSGGVFAETVAETETARIKQQ